MIKNKTAWNADVGLIHGSGRSLEEEMATHFSILAQEILWTEKPGGLQSMESQKSQTWESDYIYIYIYIYISIYIYIYSSNGFYVFYGGI